MDGDRSRREVDPLHLGHHALALGGKSRCKIGKGVLLGGDSPYTAVANYGGDGTFGSSQGSGTVAVTPGITRVKLALGKAVPTGGASITVTATVTDGPATGLLAGSVVFTPASQYHAGGTSVSCTGSASPASANNIQPVVDQVATCVLPAGWMTVPKVAKNNPHPKDGWSISAVYSGNGSFQPSFRTMRGIAQS